MIPRLRRFIQHYRVRLFLLILSVGSIIYYSWDIGSWRFAFIGDEWPFYAFAKEIADKNFLIYPFDLNGVFGEHRVLGSLWQALFIKAASGSHLGWRLANIVLIIPITFFFYNYMLQRFDKHTALYGTIFLNASFFLANYFKIGYLNPIAFALFIICLYFAQKAGVCNRTVDFILLGVWLGISYYVYIGPIFPFIVWIYLLPLIKHHDKRKVVKNILILGIVYWLFIVVSIPQLIVQFPTISNKTVFKREFNSNLQPFINSSRNLLLYFKNYDYFDNHFISGPYVDLVTRFFVLIGVVWSLFWIKKWPYLLLVLTWVTTALVIGLTSPYSYLPVTRGIFILPFGFAFAGIALSQLRKHLHRFIIALLFIVVYVINIYISQIGVFVKTGYHSTSHVIRILEEEKNRDDKTPLILVTSPSLSYNVHNIFYIQKVYELSEIPFRSIYSDSLVCDDYLLSSRVVYIVYDKEAENAIRNLSCYSKLTTEILPHYNQK